MIQFVYGQDEAISTLVAKLQGAEHGRANCKTIGIVDEQGRFLAGVVFYNWNPETGIIEMSASALNPRWFSRRTLNRIGDFVFVECGCQLLLVHLRADNEHVLQVLAGVGFTFTRVPRLFGRDQDGVICTLSDDDWYAGKLSRGRPVQEEAA
jgi:hypothetical protein